MPNSIDFRADQIQIKQIIVTGSGAGTTKLLIYGIEAQGSPVNEGLINQTVFPSDTTIGSDVFLYVSGALNTKGSATKRGTSVFGGDLVVSGSLYNGLVAVAGGLYSHAEGYNTQAVGDYSHAEGSGSYASGIASHAEGRLTFATDHYSHAEGFATKAESFYAHAEGYLTTGSGEVSHAEGSGSYAIGIASHTEGYFTKTETTGLYAHAEGYLTTGSGQASHAEGYFSIASGAYSHAEGYHTQTTGAYSHAQGSGSITWGIYSFAAGNRTIASGSVDVTQAAFGRFNKRNNTTSLFVVGNGTGDSDALRGDIFRTESTGELVLSGGIRHNAKFFASTAVTPGTTDTVNMTRNDYLVIMNTQTAPGHVYLPAITDTTKDIGLTVRIRQNDGNTSGRTVTIYVNASNAGYTINGFDDAASTLTLGGSPSGTNTNRSVTLTFMGNISSANRWFVVETSTC